MSKQNPLISFRVDNLNADALSPKHNKTLLFVISLLVMNINGQLPEKNCRKLVVEPIVG